MASTIDADYLVVGAGAMGMAFVDAVVDHSEARVAVVDRRHGPGGHWLGAYPFVRLHQASQFYGVPSTVLGHGRTQDRGPEQGLQERASQPQIVDYYDRALERLSELGRVTLYSGCEYVGDGVVVSRISGKRFRASRGCRIVDARYLAPSIPAETPPPFDVADDAHVVAVGDLPRLDRAPAQYVVTGSGKTATDACIWLLARGVDPESICWVRPRDPWMLNRAVVQPDPAVYLGASADIMQAASESTSLEQLFLRLEDAGVMLRIDTGVRPTMAKTPTLAAWELEQLRTIGNVVRRGHLRAAERGALRFDDGTVGVAVDTVVVHCAADGLKYPPLVPVWGPTEIVLQPIRAGFPCFGAGLIGYVEATREDDDEKNRLCPPSPYGDSMAGWARMTAMGARSTASFSSEPDIREWANGVTLNPARIPPGHPGSPSLDDARERLARYTPPGLAALEAMA